MGTKTIATIIAAAAAGTIANVALYRKTERKAEEARITEAQATTLWKWMDEIQESICLMEQDTIGFTLLTEEDREKVTRLVRELREKEESKGTVDMVQRKIKGHDKDVDVTYLARVEKIYGRSKHAVHWALSAKPVKSRETGYAYISVADASRKTGKTISAIRNDCKASESNPGDEKPEFLYITQKEYAAMPDEMVEVEVDRVFDGPIDDADDFDGSDFEPLPDPNDDGDPSDLL